MLLTGFCPGFFFVSSEFRTDDLWTLVWLLALAVLLGGRFSVGRSFRFGLLVGLAFAVSMKSSLLLGTLLLAGAVVLFFLRLQKETIPWRALVCGAGAALAGGAILPTAVAAFFYERGAWEQFCYCVFQHNVVRGVIETGGIPIAGRPWCLSGALPILSGLAWWILRTWPSRKGAALLFLASGFYLMALWSYWPVLSAEDYEPFFPMLFAVAAPLAILAARRFAVGSQAGRREAAILLSIAALDQSWVPLIRHPWRNDALPDIRMVGDVLKLTSPGRYVVDGKGETIYVAVHTYFALETMADARFGAGARRIEQGLVRLGRVARLDRLPTMAHRFVRANYVPVMNATAARAGQMARRKRETFRSGALPVRKSLFRHNTWSWPMGKWLLALWMARRGTDRGFSRQTRMVRSSVPKAASR